MEKIKIKKQGERRISVFFYVRENLSVVCFPVGVRGRVSWDPFWWHTVGSVELLDSGGCDIFPDDGGLVGALEDPCVGTFGDKSVTVGESLSGAHHGAVEPVVLTGPGEPEAV